MAAQRWARITRALSSPFIASFLLTALNVALCWRLFKVEFIDQFSSNEGSAIAIARYMSNHWGQFSWWPLWHCGMPYSDTYVPLLHLTVAVFATLSHLSAARAYHVVVAAAYALGPATLYLMACRLGARRGAAFTAALAYSLLAPSAFVMHEVARDIGGLWRMRRLQVLTVYGEGPHISAMTLIPLVILALESAVGRRTGRSVALAAALIALVFLTNTPGSMALGLAVYCWVWAQPRGRHAAAWCIAAITGALGYALASYDLPPLALATIKNSSGRMHPGFSNSLHQGSWALVLTLGATAAAGYLLSRSRTSVALRFAFLFFGILALMAPTANFQKFEMLPQVGRLHLEMEMGACLLLGMAAWALFRAAPRPARLLLAALGAVLIVVQFGNDRRQARDLVQYAVLPNHSEYSSARWLDTHMGGSRVYVTGSTSFWLNAFTDTPQLIGCCEQSLLNPVLIDYSYALNEVTTPEGTQAAKTWLQAMGVHALVVSGPESTEFYKDIKAPQRFEGVLPVLHREHGDTIYEIPGRRSLAHVVNSADVAWTRPNQRIEFSDIARYAAAITDESRPEASFAWLDGTHARTRANLRPADLVSVQVAWFPGWKAHTGGRSIPVSGDGLGFVLLHPVCNGPCEITLEWAGRPDQPYAAGISLAALALFVLLFRHVRPPRAFSKLDTELRP